MALTTKRLTALEVAKATKPGMYFDGEGLYLQVTGPQSRSWIYRFTLRGKARWLGLGSADGVSLADARARRDDARSQITHGIDPVEARKSDKAQGLLAEAKSVTFKEVAEKYIADHAATWRNEKHQKQWRATLETYVYPTIGALPAGFIMGSHIVNILRPIWLEKQETARRVRGRVEAILDYAADPDESAYRNPAALTVQLRKKLPKLPSSSRRRNYPALPYTEIPTFMAELRKREGNAARALEFTILTAARTSEALACRWDEIDLDAAEWKVSAARMKSQREHRVPLSAVAVDIVTQMKALRQGEFVFPGQKAGRRLSEMSMLVMLRRMNFAAATVHGFRASFRTWCAEQTSYPREVAEAALAHVIEDDTERAYQRGDMFEKRVRLMRAWGDFCATGGRVGHGVPIRENQ